MLSDKIKALRKKADLTQSELSEQLNSRFGLKTDRATVSNWERGASTPVFQTVACLAKLFDVSIDYLTDNEKENDSSNKEMLKIALFGGADDVTDEMLDEVARFAQFVAEREARKNENK
ncbi:MAG: helix-turn-helix transcriptional regulator [Clostridia bacterium]|nr:helix-turn-helix transcriptional regulator [Clostridia bacterium]